MRERGREKLKPIQEEKRGSRAYEDPELMVLAIEAWKEGEKFPEDVKLAARLQWEAGMRVKELMLIRKHQLVGIRRDEYTGEERGWIRIKGKGGKEYETCMEKETYERLARYMDEHGGEFRVRYHRYRKALMAAAKALGDSAKGKGTHGLRWNRAQRRFREVALATGPIEAQYVVSREMGHERPDITLHYLDWTRRRKQSERTKKRKAV